MRDTAQVEERRFIRKKFSEENIDFIFLKGSHLKELYPVPEIRYMVDMDVLVHPKDLEKGSRIMLEQGFEQYKDNDKDIIFTKKPCLTIELHQMLFIEDYFMHEHFVDVWENGFQEFRADRTMNSEKCKNCADKRYCMGDSAHTWNYDTNEPLLCLKDILCKKEMQ